MPTFNLTKLPRQDHAVAIITGANSGLGYFTARGFAKRGIHVVMACRNLERAADAKTKLLAEVPDGSFEIMQIDTSSLASVESFSQTFLAKFDKLDYLINNAGIMATPEDTTEDGFERQLATNYLGHFALTGRLLSNLEAAKNARVVTLSSIAHKNGTIHFDNLQLEGEYSPWKAYGQSKLACLMFAYELDRRLRKNNSTVSSIAAHPGVSDTNLSSSLPWYFKLAMPVFQVLGHSAEKGARPTLMAALHPNVKGGEYIGPDGYREMKGDPEAVPSTEASKNLASADRLWQISEKLTDVYYLDHVKIIV